MTEKQRIFRNTLLTKIHTHEFYKGCIENEAWSEFLMNNFGVISSAKLSIKELLILLDLMNGSAKTLIKPDFYGRRAIDKNLGTKKQVMKCLNLKKELGWRMTEFRKFVFKQTEKILWKDEMINSLSKAELTKLISVMNKILTWRAER